MGAIRQISAPKTEREREKRRRRRRKTDRDHFETMPSEWSTESDYRAQRETDGHDAHAHSSMRPLIKKKAGGVLPYKRVNYFFLLSLHSTADFIYSL